MAPLKSILILALAAALLLAAAPGVVSDDCSGTVSRVPPECAQELFRAIATGSNAGGFGQYQVSYRCCLLLACVREPTCAPKLHTYCPPPEDPCP